MRRREINRQGTGQPKTERQETETRETEPPRETELRKTKRRGDGAKTTRKKRKAEHTEETGTAPAGLRVPPENGRESFRLGGCEILRLEYRMPTGESAAARHAAALGAALCGFVRGTLVAEAGEALERAVRAGCGYRFSRYACRVNGKITRARGKEKLCVSFEVRAGETLLHAATAESVW